MKLQKPTKKVLIYKIAIILKGGVNELDDS